jgi:hypothetical protein
MLDTSSTKYILPFVKRSTGLYLEDWGLDKMITLICAERNGLGCCGLVDPAQPTDKCRVFANVEIKFHLHKIRGIPN